MSNYKMIPTLGLADAIKLASGRLMDFSGRSRRSEFWWWMLLVLILNMVVGQVLAFNAWLSFIAQVLVMCLGLSVTARRLQDTGRSAVWVYVSFALGILSNGYTASTGFAERIMAVNGNADAMMKLFESESSTLGTIGLLSVVNMIVSLLVIIFCCMDGNAEPNQYGESPKYVAE